MEIAIIAGAGLFRLARERLHLGDAMAGCMSRQLDCAFRRGAWGWALRSRLA